MRKECAVPRSGASAPASGPVSGSVELLYTPAMQSVLLAVLLFAPVAGAVEPPPGAFQRTEAEAGAAVEDYRRAHEEAEESLHRYQSLSRLRRDLGYVAEELEREQDRKSVV